MRFSTKCVRTGSRIANAPVPEAVPIFQTSTFEWDSLADEPEPMYTRYGNPTRYALEEALCAVENGKYALATSSGMAAVATALSMLRSGDHIVCTQDVYGGTRAYIRDVLSGFGITHTFCDCADLQEFSNALAPNTKMVWLETPSNPILKITNLRECASIAKQKGAIVGSDNTFASPYFQNPLDFGVDIVMHSTTKYINGHSDVLGGALVWNDDKLSEALITYTKRAGCTPGAIECWLILRGLRTLEIRMKQHAASAMRIAEWLQTSNRCEAVFYPGLKTHRDYDIAASQMRGFSGMLSFELEDEAACDRVLKKLNCFTLGASLGGVSSLASYPAKMSHAMMTAETRRQLGATDGLIRLSIGIEDADDLIEDLDQALSEL